MAEARYQRICIIKLSAAARGKTDVPATYFTRNLILHHSCATRPTELLS
jgi:hypothetical protein